jgi:membrane protein
MLRLRPHEYWSILKTTYKKWNADDPFRQSAVIAYYAVFSLPALLVIVTVSVGHFLGEENVSAQLSSIIGKELGSETSSQVMSMIEYAKAMKNSVLATAIAVLTLILSSTGVFIQFQKTVNTIWEVNQDKKESLKVTLGRRLLSLAMVLALGLLLFVTMLVNSLLSFFGAWIESRLPGFGITLLHALNLIVSFSLLTVLFAMMLKYVPACDVNWKNAWTGATLTSLLFTAGFIAIGLYFRRANPGTVYGAAGSLILIMLWISYSSMMILFGVEFTRQISLFRHRLVNR